jgi:cyclopropane fatty-acyl-phospholipid synthase-like methyltransferase
VYRRKSRHAVQYEPSSANLVRAALASLKIDAARFTFLDFGSGKGRVMLIAAGSPFKSVIGVELSKQLHEIARKNIALLASELTRGARVRSINDDAATGSSLSM